ncbi:hypothetical protein H8356DRAFT_957715 [Neocallimastix lanati (nom. inval.)]|nr:hypothetical protein H8356DRAFT_957715 [Neocallimastix sp. JGI-2020a]
MTTSSSNNNDSNNHSHIHSHNEDFIESEELPEGFMYLRKSYPKGPITLDRTRDDGSKLNLYSIMKKTMATTTTTNTSSENPENDEEYDDDNEDKDRVYESFKKLEEILPSQSQYLCELDREKPPEGQKGYILECPKHYTLLIEKAYYGRYENDKINCEWEWEEENEEEEKEKDLSMNLIQYCGIDSTSTMKELCEGQRMCEVKPYSTFFISLCSVRNKYLHVEYHCIKDLVNFNKVKKEKYIYNYFYFYKYIYNMLLFIIYHILILYNTIYINILLINI